VRGHSDEICQKLLKVPQKGDTLAPPLSPDVEEHMLRWMTRLSLLAATLASLAAVAGVGKVW
jgi:hypothetical protein